MNGILSRIGKRGQLLGYLNLYGNSRPRSSASRAKKKRSPRNKRSGVSRRYHRKGKQRQPHTAGKRRDTSKRRIRYTKNNQPYVILASGKARFISKKSAKASRKRSGGRY